MKSKLAKIVATYLTTSFKALRYNVGKARARGNGVVTAKFMVLSFILNWLPSAHHSRRVPDKHTVEE